MHLCGNFCLKNNRAPTCFTFDWRIGNSELNVILTCNNKLISGWCYIYSSASLRWSLFLIVRLLIVFTHAGSLRHVKDFGL